MITIYVFQILKPIFHQNAKIWRRVLLQGYKHADAKRKMLALAMYISFFLCRFHLRLGPNANPISGGIWA